MEIDNADWGAFAVSKKILKGVPVAYSIRTQSFRELNGWRLISLYDSEEEQLDPNCYTIAAMTTLIQANPMLEVMTEIFDAPFNTYLEWVYDWEEQEDGTVSYKLKGFYDSGRGRMTTVPEILAGPGLPDEE